MYMTGPAEGPQGRGHVHAVPCCAPCEQGRPCATGDAASALTGLLFPLALIGGALYFLPRMLRSR